jgi:FkbM family methyltransferase
MKKVYSILKNMAYIYAVGDSKTIRLINYLKLLIKSPLSNILKIKKEKIIGFRINFFKYSIFNSLYEEIFLKEEYFFKTIESSPIILDLGANIGMATIYFKWKYKNSQIYCIEPDPETFKILEKNIKENLLKEVHLYQKAISSEKGKISLFRPLGNKGSLAQSTFFKDISFENNANREKIIVETIKISEIIKSEKLKKIDFIKCDIEGEETNTFMDLDKEKLLSIIKEGIIEYHHEIKSTSANLSTILKILERYNFKYNL